MKYFMCTSIDGPYDENEGKMKTTYIIRCRLHLFVATHASCMHILLL